MENKFEIVFADEIYRTDIPTLDYYLEHHRYCQLNTELYAVLRKYVNEDIDDFMGIAFYFSYGLAVLTFLDKKPDTCIRQFKKISESKKLVCSSLAILYALLSIRKGNTRIVEIFVEFLREELAEMETSIGWNGLQKRKQNMAACIEKQNMHFCPVGLEWTLEDTDNFDKNYFLNKYPIENVSIKLIEHILRTADTIEEQKEAYNLIVKSLKAIYNDGHCEESVFYHLKDDMKVLSPSYNVGDDTTQKYEIRLPNMWWYYIERGEFCNYLSLGAENKKLKIKPTKEEYDDLIKQNENIDDNDLTLVTHTYSETNKKDSSKEKNLEITKKSECAKDVISNSVDKPLVIQINSKHRSNLDKAENASIIKYNSVRKGYDNGEHTSNVLVAYLCGRIFCGDYTKNGIWIAGKRFDDAKYCNDLFGFDVAATRRSSRSTGQGKSPIGYEKIDDLFEEN